VFLVNKGKHKKPSDKPTKGNLSVVNKTILSKLGAYNPPMQYRTKIPLHQTEGSLTYLFMFSLKLILSTAKAAKAIMPTLNAILDKKKPTNIEAKANMAIIFLFLSEKIIFITAKLAID